MRGALALGSAASAGSQASGPILVIAAAARNNGRRDDCWSPHCEWRHCAGSGHWLFDGMRTPGPDPESSAVLW